MSRCLLMSTWTMPRQRTSTWHHHPLLVSRHICSSSSMLEKSLFVSSHSDGCVGRRHMGGRRQGKQMCQTTRQTGRSLPSDQLALTHAENHSTMDVLWLGVVRFHAGGTL